MSPTYHEPRDPVAYDPNFNLDPNADPNLPYDTRRDVPPVVTPLVDPPTVPQLVAFLVTIRRVAPQSARRVVEIIDAFLLHYYPDGELPPEGPPPPEIQTVTVPVDSAAILALDTQPKMLVAVPAGESLEFVGATATLTFGTLPYVDALGTAVLRVMCGGTPVSEDVPSSFLTQGANFTATIFALPGVALAPDMPLTLTLVGGPVTGGDSTVSVEVNYKSWPAGSGGPAADPSSKSIPPYKFGVA